MEFLLAERGQVPSVWCHSQASLPPALTHMKLVHCFTVHQREKYQKQILQYTLCGHSKSLSLASDKYLNTVVKCFKFVILFHI